MATLAESIRTTFTPSVFTKVRELWFGSVTDDTQFVIPTTNLIKQWFTSDAGFDEICRTNFQPQLDFVIDHHNTDALSGSTILSALSHDNASSLNPLDYLSLIILLDQVPRNFYRGASAKIAFTIFDPIVLEIVKTAITTKIPQTDEIKYRSGYRLWFYLPLQHAEDRQIQDLSLREHSGILEDLKALLTTPPPATDSDADSEVPDIPELGSLTTNQIWKFLSSKKENKEALERWGKMLVSFAARHKSVVDRFGRFPHRNEVLGREPTEEEVRYLAEGGETFTSSREKFGEGHK